MKEDIIPKNEKNQPHGYCEVYWWNNNLYSKCVYINGKENGFEEFYLFDDGKLTEKNYYL